MLEEERKGEEGKEVGGSPVEGAVGDRKRTADERVVSAPPDPELVERARRRKFSAEYKLRVVREADGCTKPGEIGALLRREGLYTSHLSVWRKQRDAGGLKALAKKRGPRARDPQDAQIASLRRRAERAEAELEKARRVIEVQGNVSALLGELLEPRGAKPDAGTKR
jgi:transposase-like protein